MVNFSTAFSISSFAYAADICTRMRALNPRAAGSVADVQYLDRVVVDLVKDLEWKSHCEPHPNLGVARLLRSVWIPPDETNGRMDLAQHICRSVWTHLRNIIVNLLNISKGASAYSQLHAIPYFFQNAFIFLSGTSLLFFALAIAVRSSSVKI